MAISLTGLRVLLLRLGMIVMLLAVGVMGSCGGWSWLGSMRLAGLM